MEGPHPASDPLNPGKPESILNLNLAWLMARLIMKLRKVLNPNEPKLEIAFWASD
jgi:hypothetical protein